MKTALRFGVVFLLIGLISCTKESPADLTTTGLRQFLTDDFSFKYATDATFDIQGERENILRTFLISGPEIEIDSTMVAAYFMEIKVYEYNGEEIRNFIHELFHGNLVQNEGNVRIRGREALRFETSKNGEKYIHTGFITGGKAVIASIVVNSWSPLSIYYLTLDSFRFPN